MKFDVIIVGAGFAGAVIAERLVNLKHQSVLVIEQRAHIGGNCFDHFNDDGILVHLYGPHIFHTDNKLVWDYVSQFTDWLLYQHRVLGSIDGKLVPIPFNLNSIEQLFPEPVAKPLIEKLVRVFGYQTKIPIIKLVEQSDSDFKFLADFIYEKVFLHYTVKQWGKSPEELDPTIFNRVPVFISRDDRYFQDAFQGMPKEGYTPIFEKMLNHPNIKVMTHTHASEMMALDEEKKSISVLGRPFKGKVIYTGMLDELFQFKFGKLPYRSLTFESATLFEDSYQPVAVVNYPNQYEFTRITEFKKLTNQKHPHTTIMKEYPCDYDADSVDRNIPYYPVFSVENQAIFKQYQVLAQAFSNLVPIGRLAQYQYYDMDDIILKALETADQL